MRYSMFLFKLLVLTLMVFDIISAQWSSDPSVNTPICTYISNQDRLLSTTDSQNGIILVWRDQESWSGYDLYAQHVNSEGIRSWDPRGLPICVQEETNLSPSSIVSDNNGGAYIGWYDLRTNTAPPGQVPNSSDAYIQHINAQGEVLWEQDGKNLCPEDTAKQNAPHLVADGSGGVLVFWGADSMHNYWPITHIYGQRFNSNGEPLWDENYILIDSTNFDSGYIPSPQIKTISDRNGGAYLVVPHQVTEIYKIIRVSEGGEIFWSFTTNRVWNAREDYDGGLILEFRTSEYVDGGWFYTFSIQKVSLEGEILWGGDGTTITTINHGRMPNLSSDNDGGVYAVWVGNDYSSVLCQRYNFAGHPVWDQPDTIATNGNYWIHGCLPDSDGNLTISFVDQSMNPAYGHIFVQKISLAGYQYWNPGGALITDRPQGVEHALQMVSGAYEGTILAWSEFRSDIGYDIYGQYVNRFGAIGPTALDGEPKVFTTSPLVTSIYPNPFNTFIKISYFTLDPSSINIRIFDIEGKQIYNQSTVKNFVGGDDFIWRGRRYDGVELSSGVYIVNISTSYTYETFKVSLIK